MSATQDPAAMIQAFDATCNDGNLDEVMAFFAEDAVVRQIPPPPDGGVYYGREQIRAWFEPQIAGFHVESAGREASGESVTWNARVIFDLLREMGLNQPVDAQCEAVVRGGKITSWTVTNHAAAARPTGAR